MAIRFSVIQTTMSPLWDYGWFDCTRFNVEGPLGERQDWRHLLEEFLRDPISQRSFCDQGPWGESVQRHGPFLRERLVADWLRQLPPRELAHRVQVALDDPEFTEPPSREQRMPVQSWVDAITARGDTAFVLEAPDQPGVRVHWDVWNVYHEFVCLSPDREELTVAVIGYD